MAKNTVTKEICTYLLGICVPSSKQNAAKIRVRRLELDKHLLMYFNKFEFVYAHDPEKLCKTGDTVLIQNLPKKLTRIITHKVIEVIYPLGDITDPITGKKVVAGQYRDDIEDNAKLFGELKSKYKYDELSKRGSMENKKDFTSKKTYMKYSDDPKDFDPYAINP
ncbi:28S ribosomal protein S17, mitochondrial [Apis mellifera caucasica]|uniref:28S ribosomal protein S17, mitochondrial n=1 Tax=Apis mellifera TaxID=7460 RepID=A0A7M7RAE9_APIME|nr:28S ribosomal protein S17, mitochondrial [Apis mellifera]KAG6797171.1 28S ribosomal protein S17, mitochondrial [Apis mellifera caucasica]KAG9438019.1 28S ribosomal protein S17, mitochondrial [Apis mellifera carnica]|eukprot:XP_623556.1 28S ribosomal protein S17, mitochondrial [Apis mellifera]